MQQIADWLEKLGMSEYAGRFAENRIDFSVLPDLTDQDLEKLGFVLGDRRKMLRACRRPNRPNDRDDRPGATRAPPASKGKRQVAFRVRLGAWCAAFGAGLLPHRRAPTHSIERAAAVAKLGIKAHAHMLRHACGYKLANDGVDTRALQAYLGHRNIQNTTRYTALAPDRFKRFWRN